MGFKVHGAQLPAPHGVFNTFHKSPVLLLLAYLKPIFNQDNTIVSEETFKGRTHAKEVVVLFLTAKSHYVLNQSAVIPTAIEKYNLARVRHLLDVPLCVQL